MMIMNKKQEEEEEVIPTLTPEQVVHIEKIMLIEPTDHGPLIDPNVLDKYAGLSPAIIECLCQEDGKEETRHHMPDSVVYLNNRVPSNYLLKRIEYELAKSYGETEIPPLYKAVQKYDDPDLLKELLKNTKFIVKAIGIDPTWHDFLFKMTKRVALLHLLTRFFSKQRKPEFVLEADGWSGNRVKVRVGSDVFKSIINHVYLDHEEVDLILQQCSKEIKVHLISRQILTEGQVEAIGGDKKHAWRFHNISDPTSYQPAWKNIGESDMVGPNMPVEWVQKMKESRQDHIQLTLAKYCPEDSLPLLLGKGYDPVNRVIEARFSKDPKTIWEECYKRGGSRY